MKYKYDQLRGIAQDVEIGSPQIGTLQHHVVRCFIFSN